MENPSGHGVAKWNCLELSAQSTMGVSVKFSGLRVLIPAAALLSVPMLAAAACCPSDDNGIQLSKSGLGESLPVAMNLSGDPNWLVYGFEREGITYYQVNDLSGRVILIVGNADEEFWTLPAGKSPARVSLPSHRLVVPEGAIRHVVFRRAEFSLVVYGEGSDAVWSIELS